MDNRQTGLNLTELVVKNINKLKVIEKISITIFAIGLILFHLKQLNTDIILIIGSILAAICYFLYAFNFLEPEDLETTGILNSIGFINFLYKLMYYSLSISALSMLGLVIHFKKHNSMSVIGGTTLLIILILSLMTKLKDRTIIYNLTFYIRIITALLLLTYLTVIKYNAI